jgi:superfamily I DNA/RNA helicase
MSKLSLNFAGVTRPEPTREVVLSDEQVSIVEWGRSGKGNLVVVARAGTGKTFTMLLMVNAAPESKILVCAFNKRNAQELSEKLTNRCAEAKTLHSLGFTYVRAQWNNVRVDDNRMEQYAKQAAGNDAPFSIVALVCKLASKVKGMAPMATQADEIIDIAYEFDCIPDAEASQDGWTVKRLCDVTLKAMDACANTNDGTVDFDDMIFLPCRNGWIRPRYDLVCVDEAQDMNAAQLMIARGACKRNGRIAVIGDDRQAIYAFRGADSQSIARMKRELKATEMKLTITRRCPRAVVAYAQQLVPDYRAADDAPEGQILSCTPSALIERAVENDFILSRSNAPLVPVCLQLLRAGKRARIEGRDMVAGLMSLVKKLGRNRTMAEFLSRLSKWESREVENAQASGDKKAQARIDAIRDKAESLRFLAEGLAGVEELLSRIDQLFADDGRPYIVCSSVHRSKGLEARCVYILRNTIKAGGEEDNIHYVAVTRSQHTLVWVEDNAQAPAPTNVIAQCDTMFQDEQSMSDAIALGDEHVQDVTVQETIVRTQDGDLMTIADIARELGVDAKKARAKLRKHNLSGQRVARGSDVHTQILALLK